MHLGQRLYGLSAAVRVSGPFGFLLGLLIGGNMVCTSHSMSWPPIFEMVYDMSEGTLC